MSSRDGDAELVLLIVGVHDFNRGPTMNVAQRTLDNWSAIALELRQREVFTIIPPLPLNPTWSDEQKKTVRERNALLREWITKYEHRARIQTRFAKLVV